MHECRICGSRDIHVFMTGIFDSDTTSVLECGECGLQFLAPMMTEREEAEYYEGYYRKQQSRHFRPMELEDLQRRACEHYEQYAEIYAELVGGASSILEIGSGSGGFLRFVSENFPAKRLTSLERCKENVDFIRQCFGEKVRIIDSLDELGDETFDCVAAFGVFEHIRDSKAFLLDLGTRLSVRGTLALNVPNKFHALVYRYGLEEFKKFTYMKQHYYTFTEQSQHLLAEQAGLIIQRFNYMQVWGLDNHLSWLRYRKPRDFSDITALLSVETLASYREDMIKNKTSDLVMAVYAKK